ncbi:ABC transporter permease [Ammoniphilus sp. YIM 78166]|uniref:ABC transporter permease n=1 Tax=Ammoniphilus sp. YIM 78166 TaxID=1644106 RepID=UPI00106F4B3E|nr:ABC transporter permease [Ammoniphilus sp. YIM 78166]
MSFFHSLGMAWSGLWNYRVRTFLAMLGIAISSLLVIFLVTVLYNFKTSLVGQIQGVGVQQIVAVPGKLLNNRAMEADLSSFLSFTSISSTLTYQDAQDVKEQVPDVEAVAPQIETITAARMSGAHGEVIYTGTTTDYAEIFTLELEEGRFFTAQDEEEEALVVVLGQTAKRALFGENPAVGQTINIKGLDFTVIGVLKEKQLIGFNFNERAYAPYKVVSDTANLQNASMIFFKSTTTERIEEVEKQIDGVIVKNHGTKDFNLLKPDEALHLIDTIMKLVTAITIGITGISFLVGGIGIMNVMLLTVKERTREIGIRKAVGARWWHILLQFLAEAAYISFFGCLIGLASTYGLLQMLHAYFPVISTELPYEMVGISLVFSVALGLVFGVIPAVKAMRIKPIDALRYE